MTAGIDLDSDTILALAKHPNIVGAKFTCGNVGKIHRVAHHTTPETFAPMGGKSDFLIHGILAGQTGVSLALCPGAPVYVMSDIEATCGLANLFPKAHVECWNRYQAGDLKGALEIQHLLADADSAAAKIGGLGEFRLLMREVRMN